MRISDWSSDVCSSDLIRLRAPAAPAKPARDEIAERVGHEAFGPVAHAQRQMVQADRFPIRRQDDAAPHQILHLAAIARPAIVLDGADDLRLQTHQAAPVPLAATGEESVGERTRDWEGK